MSMQERNARVIQLVTDKQRKEMQTQTTTCMQQAQQTSH